MTDHKFFIKTITNEIPIFEKVFDSLPDHPSDWRAHADNRNTLELATIMAVNAMTLPIVLKSGSVDLEDVKPPTDNSIKKISHAFTKALEDAHEMILKMDDEEWKSSATMTMGGKNEWKTTKGEMSWGILLDLIHHRGQMSTYIRPLGGKVPSIYGPSGDTEMAM